MNSVANEYHEHVFELSEELLNCIESHKGNEPGSLLNALSDIVQLCGYVPPETFAVLEEKLGVGAATLREVCRRSDGYSNEPSGKMLISICDGTVCHNRGSSELVRTVERITGIKPGQTSDDGRFTLRLVNCMGSCSRAPLVRVDQKTFSCVSSRDVDELIKSRTEMADGES